MINEKKGRREEAERKRARHTHGKRERERKREAVTKYYHYRKPMSYSSKKGPSGHANPLLYFVQKRLITMSILVPQE